jgi:hypothetical protein
MLLATASGISIKLCVLPTTEALVIGGGGVSGDRSHQAIIAKGALAKRTSRKGLVEDIFELG